MRVGGVGPKRAAIVAVLIGVSACTTLGGSADPTDSTPTTATAAPVSVAPPTTPAPTTVPVPPPTTAPPAPTANATQFLAPADVPMELIEYVASVATNDERTLAFLAGGFQSAPGVETRPMVWTTDGRARVSSIELDLGGADEAWPAGVAVRGLDVIVAGTIRTGRVTRGVLWLSGDGGATFGPPQVVNDEVFRFNDVAFGDQGIVVVGAIQPAGSRSTPVVMVGSGSEWSTVVLPGPDVRWVSSATVDGPRVLLTGGSDVDGYTTAQFWVSGDSGTTFSSVEGFATYEAVGPVTIHNGSYVMTAGGKDDEPMVLLASNDGLGWTPTEVTLTFDGGPFASQYKGGGRMVVAADGTYITDVSTVFGYIGRISPNGNGEAVKIFNSKEANYGLIPFNIGGQVSVVSNSERSFGILSESGADWAYSAPVTSRGPKASYTELNDVGDVVAVETVSYPVVSDDKQGPSKRWSRFDGAAFWPADGMPGDVALWIANDTIEIALDNGADDPNDDSFAGPIGGTVAWVRTLPAGDWSGPELILSGPGGDALRDIDRLATGFLAVGSQYERGADQLETGTPVILEFRDGTWTPAVLPPLGGNRSSLSWAVGSPNGLALAIGSTNDSAISGPLVFSRNIEGVWSRIDLPVSDRGAYVIFAGFTDDHFEVILADHGSFILLRSGDGVTFESHELRFADPFRSRPESLATIGGVTYVVGVDGDAGAEALALWELNADGSLTPVEIVGGVPAAGIAVDSVIADGLTIWVGGRANSLNYVWRLDGLTGSANPGSGTAATPSTIPDVTTVPAATTAPATSVAS